MRINLSRWLILSTPLLITACTPAPDQYDEYGTGYIVVHEIFWGADHEKPYPFTVSGEITCGMGPFGREVYFEPEGFIDESSIGTPLNKPAQESLKRANMTPNVPYSIEEGADLSDAVEVGLNLCDEQTDLLSE